MTLIEFHDALERSGGMIGKDLRAIGERSRWHAAMLDRWLRYYGGRTPHKPTRPVRKGGLIEVTPGEWHVLGRYW